MKKLLICSTVILIIFLIYLCNMDQKVYYLVLGDSLASGTDAHGKNIGGYAKYVKKYLKDKDVLEVCVDEFAQEGYRTYDIINSINNNKHIKSSGKKITIQNALIKADLVTISIGANDILNKINTAKNIEYNNIYDYIDELSIDLDKLLKLIKEYCKEDIILIGYYNPYSNLKEIDKIIEYLNKKYSKICKKYNVSYVQIDTLFKENPEFIPNNGNIHPSKAGYKAISGEIIGVLSKTPMSSV